MALLKQSTTYTRVFFMVDSTDHVSGKTALTVTVNLSKAGGSFAAAGGTITELTNGWYKIAYTTTDTGTLGDLGVRCTATGADPTEFVDQVVAIDVGDAAALGLSRLDTNVGSRSTLTAANVWDALLSGITTASTIGKLLKDNIDAAVTSRASATDYTSARATKIDNLDATVSSRSSHTAADVWASGTRSLTDKAGFGLSALESLVVHAGTAQAGAATTVTLAAGASSTTDYYVGQVVRVYGGTGAGQGRVVTAYNGTTKVATVSRAWATNPDNTSTYAVMAVDAAKLDATLRVEASSVQGNVTGSVGSVTGNVGGNVVGSVGSVSSAVDILQSAADKVWSTTTRTLSAFGFSVTVGTNGDKTGYGLSAAAVQAVWDAATSALTTAGSIGKRLADDVDATISSRLSASSYAAAPTTTQIKDAVLNEATSGHTTAGTVGKAIADAAAGASPATIADAVWDEVLSGHLTGGTTGASLNGAGAAGDPWTASLGGYGTGTAGKLVNDNLDARVSTRSTHAAADVWAVGTRTLSAFGFPVDLSATALAAVWDRLLTNITTASSIGKLIKDTLDATVSSRLPAASYVAPDNAGVATLTGRLTPGRATNLDHLDADVSSRSTLDAAGVWSSGTRTLTAFGFAVDLSGAAVAAVWDRATSALTTVGSVGKRVADFVDAAVSSRATPAAVWGEPLPGAYAAGTAGARVTAAGNAGDPWAATLPAAYPSGTAGSIIGRIGTAAVSVTSPVAQNGDVEVRVGDDYAAADGRALGWSQSPTGTPWPDLPTGTTVAVDVGDDVLAGSVVVPTGSGKAVHLELTAAQTAEMGAGVKPFTVTATLPTGRRVTLVQGTWTAKR
jgi:hypothetical protein